MRNNSDQEFFPIGDETRAPGKEVSLPKEELYPTGSEYFAPGCEIQSEEATEESFQEASEAENSKSKKNKLSELTDKIKKMGYLVAASVSVAAVSSTALGSYAGSSRSTVFGRYSNDVYTVGETMGEEGSEFYFDAFVFPDLPNLEPDSSGTGKQYIKINDEFIYKGSSYDGVTVSDFSGVRYNISSNTLYLTNADIDLLEYSGMGNGFTISLSGSNYVGGIRGYGSYTGGSLTFAGTGNLNVNIDKKYDSGLYIDGEQSETCLMVKNTIDYIDIYANSDAPIVIANTTSYFPLYFEEGIGHCGFNNKSSSDSMFAYADDGTVAFSYKTYRFVLDESTESGSLGLIDFCYMGYTSSTD